MKLKLKFSLDVFLIAFALIIPMIGYLNYLFRGFVTSWLLILIYLFYTVFNKRKTLLSKNIKSNATYLVMFLIVVFISFIFIDQNDKSLQYFLTFLFFLFLFFLDLLFVFDLRKKMTIIYLIYLALGLQAIISIPYILNGDYLVMRHLASGQLSEELVNEAIKNGVGTNALYTSLASLSLFGIVIINHFKNLFVKVSIIIAVSCMVFSIVISTFFASILMLVVGALMLFLFRFKKILNFKFIFILLLFTIMSIFIFNRYIVDTRLLDPIKYKIERFSSEQEDITDRGSLAQVSLETFYNNPFFGIGIPQAGSYDKIGEHTPWIDFLAHFGFIGVLPLILWLYKRIKYRFQGEILTNSLNAVCLIGVLLFIASNFVSPMITTPVTYISFIFIFTSISFKKGHFIVSGAKQIIV